MKCPDEGKLLLYLENQLSADDHLDTEHHLNQCAACSKHLEVIRESYNCTAENLTGLWNEQAKIPISGQEKVWNNIIKQKRVNKKGVSIMKIKKYAIAAALVLSLGVVGSMPSVQAVAANLLQVFRVEQVDTLTMSLDDMEIIEQNIMNGEGNFEIDDFGSIQSVGESGYDPISSEEIAKLDFQVKYPTLTEEKAAYNNLQKTPIIEIKPKVGKVNELLKQLGSSYSLPQALDSQTCRFTMGDALVSNYNGFELIQGLAPQIEVPNGVSVQEVARAMVALPIWPDNIKTQLESVGDWEHTLLIPDENAKKVKINGNNGVLLDHQSNRVVIWQADGLLYMIEDQSTGESETDLIAIAESLR